MKKKNMAAGAFLISLQLAGAMPAGAAGSGVKVQLPAFPVQVNGTVIDNRHAAYPLLVYRDITYFPMTWDYAQGLGLSVDWSPGEGFSVMNRGTTLNILKLDESGSNSAGSGYTAVLPSYPIRVNGETVDNAKEPYPLLNFRGITYFPMTWHYAHDVFRMHTEWNAEKGFGIITPQQLMFQRIMYDDADYLYVDSNPVLKIRKTLDGAPAALSSAEEKSLYEQSAGRERALFPPIALSRDTAPATERSGDSIRYHGKEIVALSEFAKGRNVSHREAVYPIDDARSLLILSVTPDSSVPAPYTPYTRFPFVIDGKEAVPVIGASQLPQNLISNADGSSWIFSPAPIGTITAATLQSRGELLLAHPDGTVSVMNSQLNVHDIDVVSQEAAGSLIIRAYSRFPNETSNPAFGIYRIDTKGQVSKLSDMAGRVYKDRAGDLYVIDPELNKITNLTQQKSRTWYDYELFDLLSRAQ